MSMDAELRSAFVDAVYSDEVDDIEQEQPLLAHYTSLATIEKIVSNSEIWFSHPLLMNDHEEVSYGIRAGTEVIERSDALRVILTEERRFQIFLEGFNSARRSYYELHLFDTYVFCLSRHESNDNHGRLSMWRGYGGNGTGAAIVFDTKKLDWLPNSALIAGRVVYLSTKERSTWLERYVARIEQFLYRNRIPDADLAEVGAIVFERLKTASIFSKHCGFDEEQEWRVVYMPERDPQGLLAPFLSYHNGPRGVEPKLCFKVAPLEGMTKGALSLDLLIDRIILGPSRSPLALGAAKRMLSMMGKPNLAAKLTASEIPYRGSS